MTPYDLSVYVAKSFITLLVITVLYRLLGKRYVSQFNVYDLVTVVALSNAAQNGMTEGKGDLSIGLVAAFTLVATGWLLGKIYRRLPGAEKLLVGEPTLLLYEGRPITATMKRQQISNDELEVALRAHGLTSPAEAAMAVLETDGSISIVPHGKSCRIDQISRK